MARPIGVRLRVRAKALSMDLTRWVVDARTDDLITSSEEDDMLECARRISEIGKTFG